jgi:hypothetical protein
MGRKSLGFIGENQIGIKVMKRTINAHQSPIFIIEISYLNFLQSFPILFQQSLLNSLLELSSPGDFS